MNAQNINDDTLPEGFLSVGTFVKKQKGLRFARGAQQDSACDIGEMCRFVAQVARIYYLPRF